MLSQFWGHVWSLFEFCQISTNKKLAGQWVRFIALIFCSFLKCCLGTTPKEWRVYWRTYSSSSLSCCPLRFWRSFVCASHTLVSLLYILNSRSSNLVKIWSIALASAMFWSLMDCACCTWLETDVGCKRRRLGDGKFINSGGSSSTRNRGGC